MRGEQVPHMRPDWALIHRQGPPRFWFPFLAFFCRLYGAGVGIRQWGYQCGLMKRESLPGAVVSIGNLTAGGTGKTPAVLFLASWAAESGYRVAVLSRGYGGKYGPEVLVVSDGTHLTASPRESGDEPYLLAKRLQNVPVLVSRKRYQAGWYAHEKLGCDFFILDDGFQHVGLERDLDLVLIDSESPFGNGYLLPLGPLREPVDHLSRADACVLTRFKDPSSGDGTLSALKKRFPGKHFFCANHVPEKVVFPGSGKELEPEHLKGKRVVAFAGIAKPDTFRLTLETLGADLAGFRSFRDHYSFRPEDIRSLITFKQSVGAGYLLTTEKDWVRIASIGPEISEIGYLSIRFSLIKDEDAFFRMIRERAEAKIKSE